MDPAGERGVPTFPKTSTRVLCTILPDWALQSWEEGEGEGRNKSRFLVDVFPWPSLDWLLQLSTAQHLSSFAPHIWDTHRGCPGSCSC